MTGLNKQPIITICSDSVGETAEAVVKATIRQFDLRNAKIKRYSHVLTEAEIRDIVGEVAANGGMIAYTLVQPDLRELIREESLRLGVRTVDVMGPMMQAFIESFDGSPTRKPGMLHQMDDDYFRRVEAIEFTVSCDDGRDPRALLNADIVLIGVSRPSKTPLSMFLAHKGYKVANLPLIPEVKPAAELFQIPPGKIAGLIMDPEKMLKIRVERLRALGLTAGAKYANMERITFELNYAKKLMEQLGCLTINVSDKAIEETAGIILEHL